MFQRIHLSALLSLAARCVKGELSVSTGISRLTSISTPSAGEAFSGLGSQPLGRYITPDIINVQFEGERKWNVSLPANMLRLVSPRQSD